MKQNVDGLNGTTQLLHKHENLDNEIANFIDQIMGNNSILGYSSHHQANDKIGKGLTTVIESAGVPKLILSDDARFILTQFHPEEYALESASEITESNRLFQMGEYYVYGVPFRNMEDYNLSLKGNRMIFDYFLKCANEFRTVFHAST